MNRADMTQEFARYRSKICVMLSRARRLPNWDGRREGDEVQERKETRGSEWHYLPSWVPLFSHLLCFLYLLFFIPSVPSLFLSIFP
jgi:hypothetical protein